MKTKDNAAPAPSASPAADQAADRQWRAGFLAGWNAGIEGDEAKLRAAQNRVGKLADYEASASPAPYPAQPFAVVIDRTYDGEGPTLAVWNGENYSFSDGDCFERETDGTLDGYNAEWLTHHQLERRLFPAAAAPAAPQPSAKALTDEHASFEREFSHLSLRNYMEDGLAAYCHPKTQGAWEGWQKRALLAAEQPSEKLTEAQIAEQPARYAIDGAITFGRTGQNEPPAGHWLTEYWHIGRQLAKLGETSIWDNQTPVDSQPSEDKRDSERLDFLDGLNRRLNEHYGTVYGWELILSPNIVRLMSGPGGRGHLAAIDLNDSKARGAKSCREAIDAAIAKGAE